MSDENSTSNEYYQRLKPSEAFNVAVWVLKMIFSISPLYATIYLITSVLLNVRSITYSYVFAKVIDALISTVQKSDASISDMYPYLFVLLGLNAAITVIRAFDRFSSRQLDLIGESTLKKRLYDHLLSLGIQTLEEPEVNNKILRANNALYRMVSYFRGVVEIAASIGGFMVSSILLIQIMPEFLLIILVLTLPQFLVDKKYRRLLWKLGLETTEKRRRAWACSWDLADGPSLKEIIINNASNFLSKKFTDFTTWYAQEVAKIRKTWLILDALLNLLNSAGIYFGYLLVMLRFLAGKLSVGSILFQIRLLDNVNDSFQQVLGNIGGTLEQSLQIKDTYNLFQVKPAIADGTKIIPILNSGPKIVFNNVSFIYPEASKKVLKTINLTIQPNEKIAIVGHNGAGKTTLVKLLCRIYRVTKGSININGDNINQLKTASLYKNISALFQDYNMYQQLTVEENITIGDSTKLLEEEKIIQAVKSADAWDFIEEFPQKMNQILDIRYKGGIRPSTGQWQKLALARLFYRNAPLVIFDEPTAAIDAESEYKIFNEIYNFFENKTVIIISHRFSTVRNADRIIVLDHGEIIEEGSHHDLIEKGGYYAKSFKLQAEGYSS